MPYGNRPSKVTEYVLAAGITLVTSIVGIHYAQSHPFTEGGKARLAAHQKLEHAPRIRVHIDAQGWRSLARQELRDAGIDMHIAGADPLHELESVVERENGRRPWEQSGVYTVPSYDLNGVFGSQHKIPNTHGHR